MSDLLDPNVVQRQASDPKASVWVAANAGTGKTKVLTDRVLSLMVTGTKPRSYFVPDLYQGGCG